jgi:hypothetical protein
MLFNPNCHPNTVPFAQILTNHGSSFISLEVQSSPRL